MATHENKPISEHKFGDVDAQLRNAGVEPLSESELAAFDDMRQADREYQEQWQDEARSGVVLEPEPAPPTETEKLAAERDQMRQERDQIAEQHKLLTDRTNQIFGQLQAQAQAPMPAMPQQQQIPAVEHDPLGHLLQKQRVIEQHLVQRAQQENYQRQLAATAQVIGALQTHATQLEAEFEAKNPDYADAISFLQEKQHKSLEAIGHKNRGQRQQIIYAQGLEVAAAAVQRNENPAEVLYNLAKAQGYAPYRSGRHAQERIERLRAGQQQGRSLSNVRGGGPKPLSHQALLEMSYKDFDAAMKTPEGRRLLGE